MSGQFATHKTRLAAAIPSSFDAYGTVEHVNVSTIWLVWHSLMIVYERDGIPWPEREDRIVQYLPQVILRSRFADIMEVVV